MIFEDGTDIYWARSRVIEYLSKITARLPSGVNTELGPDATSVGWVFQYALVDESGTNDLTTLRTYQDWYLRYYLQCVPGVSEVATVGGFVRQYQVNVDPNKLAAYKIPIEQVVEAIRRNNNDVGGRLVEFSGREYMVRGRGYAKSTADIEKIGIGTDPATGTPVTIKQIGVVELGPDIRRGIADLDGKGDAVGGIVVMRHGENALRVIDRVKEKLEEIKPSLPPGVKIVTTYDRSELILESIATLTDTDRGDHNRLDSDPPLPVAHTVCIRPDLHDPGLGAAGIHSLLLHETHGQHHVARRHRHIHRRAGRRRDCGGGERIQETRALEGGRPQRRLSERCGSRRSRRWALRSSFRCS